MIVLLALPLVALVAFVWMAARAPLLEEHWMAGEGATVVRGLRNGDWIVFLQSSHPGRGPTLEVAIGNHYGDESYMSYIELDADLIGGLVDVVLDARNELLDRARKTGAIDA